MAFLDDWLGQRVTYTDPSGDVFRAVVKDATDTGDKPVLALRVLAAKPYDVVGVTYGGGAGQWKCPRLYPTETP